MFMLNDLGVADLVLSGISCTRPPHGVPVTHEDSYGLKMQIHVNVYYDCCRIEMESSEQERGESRGNPDSGCTDSYICLFVIVSI